ncbi:MFS transporter [Microbacterium lushaniae]|nr:MFS transporter [Microbacterium lushaniae]
MPDTDLPVASGLAGIQRRTVAVLAAAQGLGGVAFGASLSLGVLLAADVAGDESVAGLATASLTFGTALAAIPLAVLARRRGRRLSLTTGMLVALAGVLLVLVATGVRSFPLLLVAFALVGAGQAVNLQSRFAATDLATDATRGRSLSLVVWATTVGVVLGPNLVGPGEAIGAVFGMPPLTGPYLFTIVGQVLAVVVYVVWLRPDPLLLAARVAVRDAASRVGMAHPDRPAVARYAIFAVAAAHAVMVSVMAMTPVHLVHHGASLSVVGLTISLHVAGMFALSPVFGILSDRIGRGWTILVGQVLLVAALVLAAVGADSMPAVTTALVLLGLGWSATTVSGSALLTEASAEEIRTRRQGLSDFTMSLVGAAGAVVAGFVLAGIGYGGLALTALVLVAAVCVGAPIALKARVP